MIIHSPITTVVNGVARVSARVETDRPVADFPQDLWFEFPERYLEWVHHGMEPFVVSLLHVAMAMGEDMVVDGPLSQKLVFALRDYQRIYHHWLPHDFRPSVLHFDGYTDPPPGRCERVLTSFSGGVDSFYTLWKQLPAREPLPEYRVTDALFIYFNRPKHRRERYEARAALFKPMLAAEGVNLIPLSMNSRLFLVGRTHKEKSSFIFKSFAPGLSGAAMIFSGCVGKYFLPSGATSLTTKQRNFSSDLRTDPMISTEWFETIHHGSTVDRASKLEAIADWPPVQELLSVCLIHTDVPPGCGECAKCVRTMTTLRILGKLDQFPGFEMSRNLIRYRWMGRIYESTHTLENYQMAKRYRRPGFILLTGIALIIARSREALRDVLKWLHLLH